MAGCDCLHMFCLGILQRSACFFYDICGGFFSPLSSVLLSLPCGMFPEAFTFGAGVISQSFIGPIRRFWVSVVAVRSSSRTSREIVFGLRTLRL